MTINEAIAAAIADWRSRSPNVPDAVLADTIRNLVDEAIDEYLPDAEGNEDPDGVRYVEGDALWYGATPGWYRFRNGDSEGPFDTEAEANA